MSRTWRTGTLMDGRRATRPGAVDGSPKKATAKSRRLVRCGHRDIERRDVTRGKKFWAYAWDYSSTPSPSKWTSYRRWGIGQDWKEATCRVYWRSRLVQLRRVYWRSRLFLTTCRRLWQSNLHHFSLPVPTTSDGRNPISGMGKGERVGDALEWKLGRVMGFLKNKIK